MPATIKLQQRASSIVERRPKTRNRHAATICSRFVLLLSLALVIISNSAELKVSTSLSVEATFSTVLDLRAADVTLYGLYGFSYDQLDGFNAIWCACA